MKEEYELQEKCGKRCEERFRKEYGKEGYTTDKDGDGMTSGYQNHYNKKLNKCFILITTRTYPKDKDNKLGVYTGKDIYDINENQVIGSFSMFSKSVSSLECRVSERTCKSGEEWDLLVKPYMEE